MLLAPCVLGVGLCTRQVSKLMIKQQEPERWEQVSKYELQLARASVTAAELAEVLTVLSAPMESRALAPAHPPAYVILSMCPPQAVKVFFQLWYIVW